MSADEQILRILKSLHADVSAMKEDVAKIPAIEAKVDRLEDGQAHTNTVLKTLATKQDVEVAVDSAKSELEAKIGEVRSDVLRLDSKVVKNIQSLNRRTTNLEDQSGIENPEKH
jgi:hypothetical protein